MNILSVDNLCKKYDKFALKGATFSLDEGYIMGFIGRNGAGKTTTLKSMLGLVHSDAGSVKIAGRDMAQDEFYCKQKIGLVLGGADYYPKTKLKTIADVTRRFYSEWDEAAYREYLERFELDDDKRVEQLSSGMRVKFSLALALSHNAQLLILDEPTSGLDPVSRDDLLELFQQIIEDGKHSILFSTHITSDLDKCADFITYIKDGEILASTERDNFIDTYRVVRGSTKQLEGCKCLIGVKENAFGFTALVKTADLDACAGLELAVPDLETIMIHLEKE